MIIWCEGREYPIKVQAGDVLFIAGCLALNLTEKPPFEHVVITAESRLIEGPDDFLKLPVYGMPESSAELAGDFPGIRLQDGRYWLGRRCLGRTIGSSQTVWNLGSRASGIDASTAREMEFNLAQQAGSFLCRYEPVFRVDPSLSQEIETRACL